MSEEDAYHRAATRADLAKANFLSSITAAKARLSPAHLKQDVKHKISETVSNGRESFATHAKAHPIAVGSAAGAVVLYLLRKPLAALYRRLHVQAETNQPDHPETDNV